MQISPLDQHNQAAALAYLRTSPYRNALPLSNATQLRSASDVLVATEQQRILGVISTYRSLPIANLTFAARSGEVVGDLIAALADRNPQLRAGPAWALLPLDRHRQLTRHAQIISLEIEYQMVAEPETLRANGGQQARRLGAADAPAMTELASAAGLSVWHPDTIELGPAYGCFADGGLVAMAATHFATSEIIEIGHVATHPRYRRQGYASACTAALAQAAFKLAPRVFLMVLEQNKPALEAYKRLGFQIMERMCLSSFILNDHK